jgi:hypothetical protein
MSLKPPNGASAIVRHIGWDHATHLSSRKTVQGYYDQGEKGIKREKPLKDLIDRLKKEINEGVIPKPDIKEYVV